MPDGLDLMRLSEIEHTVKPGAHGQATGVVLAYAECAELSGIMRFHPVRLRIVFIIGLPEEPVLAIAYTRCEVQILCKRKVRQTYLEVVSHSVLELVHESLLHELRRLEIDSVLQGRTVSEREFLIELFLSHAVLFLERIKSRYGESQVRKGEGIRAVTRVLVMQRID